MRIYIESTIPSYVVARPARDLLQAARQQLTLDWWQFNRTQHELFTSQVVLDEIAQGDVTSASLRMEVLADIELLESTVDAESLALRILDAGVLPPHAGRDAAHIAIATVHAMDVLLSWNCRHIANAANQHRLRRLAQDSGFVLPVLCTPEEMTGDFYE